MGRYLLASACLVLWGAGCMGGADAVEEGTAAIQIDGYDVGCWPQRLEPGQWARASSTRNGFYGSIEGPYFPLEPTRGDFDRISVASGWPIDVRLVHGTGMDTSTFDVGRCPDEAQIDLDPRPDGIQIEIDSKRRVLRTISGSVSFARCGITEPTPLVSLFVLGTGPFQSPSADMTPFDIRLDPAGFGVCSNPEVDQARAQCAAWCDPATGCLASNGIVECHHPLDGRFAATCDYQCRPGTDCRIEVVSP